MAVLRRIVFGEPHPGFSQFASILAKGLLQSDSYCNHGTLNGATGHDLITDVPWSIPPELDFQHPSALKYLTVAAAANDPWFAFRYHHIQLYQAGVAAVIIDPITIEAVRLCRAIYAYPGDPKEPWDHQGVTSGVAWAVRLEGDRAYVVFRGSDDLLDWLRDLTAFDPDILIQRLLHHDQFGPMWDGFMTGMEQAWAAIRPLLLGCMEVVFTGHSLGAARADIAAAYAVLQV